MPFAAFRGGSRSEGRAGGAFSFYASVGPSFWHWFVGFRCAKNAAGATSPTLVADNAVTAAKVVDGSLALADLGPSGCADGQMPKWDADNSRWVCAYDLGGQGAQYDAGAGLDLSGTTFQVDPIGLASVLHGWDQDESDDLTEADLDTLDQRWVNAGGDSMSGALSLPSLAVSGDAQVEGTLTVGSIKQTEWADSDFITIEAGRIDNIKDTNYVSVATCPDNFPVPVSCNCLQATSAGGLLAEHDTRNWDKPSQWESGIVENRARCFCSWFGRDSAGKAYARIVCRKK